MYGPHGAPDFFTEEDIETVFSASWKVHYNSDRTGVRLIGPKPAWARPDGGEAGLHPSNIHDNAYAIGTVDFTGDMPVILGPDGPSLGGFVCPATIVNAELWKMGQLDLATASASAPSPSPKRSSLRPASIHGWKISKDPCPPCPRPPRESPRLSSLPRTMWSAAPMAIATS